MRHPSSNTVTTTQATQTLSNHSLWRRCMLATTLLAVVGCGASPTGVIQTASGPVQGVAEDGVSIFRGIPYAQAPVGDLRWARPAPVTAWQHVHYAESFGPACWQATDSGDSEFLERLTEGAGMGGFTTWMLTTFAFLATPEVSEDCLTLNIVAPEEAENLPVMFWIHGGGHAFGSGGGPYESAGLAKHGTILVSINYRLGLYGFLAHPELAAEDPHGSTGNYGTLDQIAALNWVRENIAQFGGDPENVTIFGESAGGHSVGQLMASPIARGLFHRAIAQSGTGFYQFQDVDAAHENLSGFDGGKRVAELARNQGLAPATTPERDIDWLRRLSVDELSDIALDEEVASTLHPQIDGYVLPKSTAQIFAEGTQAAIPLVVGSNADEGTLLYHFGLSPVDGANAAQPSTLSEWEAMLAAQFGDAAEDVASHYAVDQDRDVARAAEQLMGDSWFGRHAFYMAASHSESGHPTYLYFYERHPPSDKQTLGATHALELNHVFDGLIPGWPADERDDDLRDQMQGFWTAFAAQGDPNQDALPNWPRFEDLQAYEMNFGHESSRSRRVDREDRYRAMRAQFEARVTRASANSTPMAPQTSGSTSEEVSGE